MQALLYQFITLSKRPGLSKFGAPDRKKGHSIPGLDLYDWSSRENLSACVLGDLRTSSRSGPWQTTACRMQAKTTDSRDPRSCKDHVADEEPSL